MPARKPGSNTGTPLRLDDPFADLAQLVAAMDPGDVESWSRSLAPEDLAIVEQVMADFYGAGWRTDPATMAAHLDPKNFQRWPYVALLSEKFRDACDGRSKRQIWNLPARYGKSLVASQWGPVWCLDRTGGKARIILWSYGKALAVENAVGIRDRLAEHSDVLRAQLRPDRRRMDRFVTDAGGGVIAAGVGTRVRGFGAGAGGGIVIDDPFKDWQDAHSEHQRDVVWNQYRGTILDRIDDEEAWIIVVHHRVHEDDLTGRLCADQASRGDKTWEHIVLPAIATDDDVLGRKPGETLEPKRFSLAYHKQLALEMGSYLAGALQQQDPTPEEGTDLLRAWFRLYATEDDPVTTERFERLPAAPNQSATSWDLKLKDKEAGDYVVGQAWWRTGPDFWLVGQLRGHWDHSTTANAIALLAVRHPECQMHAVESAGAYEEVAAMLRRPQPAYVVSDEMAAQLVMDQDEREQVQALRRRGLSGIVPHPPKGDKRERARTYIASHAEAGNVHLPAYAEWLPHLLDEVAAFPNATHDDQVDAMSQALQRLGVGEARLSSSKGKRTPKPGSPSTSPTPVIHRAEAGGTRQARVSRASPGRRLGRPR